MNSTADIFAGMDQASIRAGATTPEAKLSVLLDTALAHVRRRTAEGMTTNVLEIGASEDCSLAKDFAEAGANVLIVDSEDISKPCADLKSASVVYLQNDVAKPQYWEVSNKIFDVVFSSLTLHRLPFRDAWGLLSELRLHLSEDAMVYLLTSGLDSELGVGYEGYPMLLEDRYSPLSPAMQSKYGMPGNVCLYSAAELEMLMVMSKLLPVCVTESPFGNVEGIAMKHPKQRIVLGNQLGVAGLNRYWSKLLK